MASPWPIFKAVADRKIGDLKGWVKGKKQVEPIDRNLPLGLHIDGKIKLDRTPFLLLKGSGSKTEFPGKELVVRAWGSAKFGNFVIHTFYLTPDDNDEEQSMLRIVTDQEGIAECRLFRTYLVEEPQTSEQWNFWFAETDGSLGLDQFQDKEGNLYQRVWEPDAGSRIKPYRFAETIYADRDGTDRFDLSLQSMLYGREIVPAGDGQDAVYEYMLVDCIEDQASAQVHIKVGLDIEPRSITVVY